MALGVCVQHGYQSVTMAHIAEAAGMTVHDLTVYFATKDAVVLAVLEDFLEAAVAALTHTPPSAEPLETLRSANTEVIKAITAGTGAIPRERLEKVAQILTAAPELRAQAKMLRMRVLTQPLAEHLVVDVDDPGVQHAITMWSAVIAAAYNHDHPTKRSVHPSRDGRVLEVMVGRLNDTFTHITGRQPRPQ
jgi:AcrR family transcriptional regulator